MGDVLRAEDVRKAYGRKSVLNGVNLTLEDGEVCALLGKNGAGKTTFIRILLGLAFADAGAVQILACRPGHKHANVAFLSENLAVYPHLSASDNLRVAALSAGLPPPTRVQVGEMLDRVALTDVGRKRAGAFSLGMKRRLQLAMATLPRRADLLVLDEPTNGLDVNGLLLFKQFLGELRSGGATVLMASHALLELQEVVTSYAILSDGVVRRRAAWNAADTASGTYLVEVASSDLAAAQAALAALGARVTATTPTRLTVAGSVPQRTLHEALHRADIVPESVERESASLEEIFRSVADGAGQ